MQTFEITAPDGQKYRVTGPDGSTEQDALAQVQAQHATPTPPPAADTSAPLINMAGIKRGAGLGTRDLIEGLLSFPKLGANALAGIGNLGLKGVDTVSGGRVPYRLPYQGEAVSDMLGLPQPQSPSERMISGISRPIYGAATGIAGGGAIPGPVGSALAAQPVRQLVGAATGGAAGEATRQAGGGPVAQTVAAILGGVSPSLLTSGIPALGKGLARGGSSMQNVRDAIDAFQQAGASPSAGQATQNRFMQGAESLLTRVPGGAGVMARAGTKQAQDLGAGMEKLASTLSTKSSAEQAGRSIAANVTGPGGFVDKFKAAQGALYDKLDEYIPATQRIDVSNTKDALDVLNASIPGAPNVSAFFKNAKMGAIQGAMKADTEGVSSVAANPELPMFANAKSLSKDDQGLIAGIMADGKLPYEAVKKLRTLVGNELSDWNITSDVPRSKWKSLYGALSEDLKTAANQAGPDATQAWNRANWFTRAGMSRIDTLNSVVDKAGGPEKIFAAATSGTKEGATTLRAVMQSLPEDGQKMLSATVIRRLGRATSGQQNDLGDKFSTETFLTNWNSLSPEAKSSLFDRYGSGFRASMDNVAKVAANLRSGSKVWQNPSGTSQAIAQTSALTAFVLSLAHGELGTAGAIGGGVTGANITAKLFTNPRFVQWLGTAASKPVSAVPTLLNQLVQRGRLMKDQDLIDAANFLQPTDDQGNH